MGLPTEWVFVVYGALGLVLGLALERGRLCFVTAFRDAFSFRNPWLLSAVFISIGVSAAAVGLLSAWMGTQPTLLETGWYVTIGGFVFGVGVAIAGACASGILFRIPEGYTASAVELAGFSGGILLWAGFLEVPLSGGYGTPISIPQLLGLPFSVYALVSGLGFVLAGLYLGRFVPRLTTTSRTRWTLDPRSAWDPRLAALIVAAVQIVLFALAPNALLGFTAPFATFGAVALEGAGVNMSAVPWVGTSYLGVYPLVVLTVAAFVGAGFGAFSSKDFKVRIPRKRRRLVQALLGGILAGLGAGVGLGCNIGNFYAGFGLRMDVSALLFAPGLVAGILVGTRAASKL